ncbi:MAG: cob(I)yrinic acid a,c-diamide adenosyltransferase [Chlorobi bacterium]|nr:cob(I)yrinic acid a,c-diamide adenosyltransferase [Chlorobiota bacterium]
METGLIHIYTGEGKGKTTAAVGLAIRALSHGLRVCYVNFNKGGGKYVNTEVDTLEILGAKVIVATDQHPAFNADISAETNSKQTLNALGFIKELVRSADFDMLILDEILISVRDNFIQDKVLVDFIKNKPDSLELVLTGRGATGEVIEMADYVSEIVKVKHPYDNGIFSREGIEY